MNQLIDKIQKELKDCGSIKWVESTRKFVPSAQHVYGVNMPTLNDMARRYQDGDFPLVQQLWASGSFEERMLAGKILNRIARKDPALALKLIKRFGKDISDWAVCDCLGTQAIKKILKTHQEEIFEMSASLVKSKRMWARRLGLVLLEGFTGDASLKPAIQRIIRLVESDEEYYVKKVVTWLNRNFQKKR